jgi:tetratricopeptide (TPR) repeat protein
LAGLIGPGAATLAGLVVTDAWQVFRKGLSGLFGRSGEGPAGVAMAQVEEARARVRAARERGDERAAAVELASLEALLRERLVEARHEVRAVEEALAELIGQARLAVARQDGIVTPGPGRPVSGSLVSGPRWPRLSGTATPYYRNHEGLLRRMDAAFARNREVGAPTRLYLTGVAGVGVRSTALHWVRRRDELRGVPQLECGLGRDAWGGLPDPAAVLERWLHQLGVAPQDVPADQSDRLAYFRSAVEPTGVVVVLRDIVTPSQVAQLLPETPGSVAVMTSRLVLPGLVGRYHAEPLTVEPLDVRDGILLIADVGRLGEKADRYAAHLNAIAGYCRGLPLALCTAGALLAVGPEERAADLARSMADPQGLLRELAVDEDLSVPAAFDAGYGALAPDAALAYRRIGLLPVEDFDAEMLACVLPEFDSGQRYAAVRELERANLVEPVGENRYRVKHPLIHAHALSRALAEDGPEEVETVRDRVLDLLVAFAERCEAALSSRYRHDPEGTYAAYAPTGRVDEAAVVRQIDLRYAALRSAVRGAYERGRYERVWRLAQALHTYHLKCHLHSDWVEVHRWAVKAAWESTDPMVLPRMRFEYGFARLQRWSDDRGDARAAVSEFEEVLRGLESVGVPWTEGQRRTASSAWEALGLARRKAGAPERALEHYDAAEAALAGVDHERGLALLEMHRAACCTDLGRHEEAERRLRAAHRRFGALTPPDAYNQGRTLTLLAQDRLAAGLLEQAGRALDEAVALLGERGGPYQRGDIRMLRGTVRARLGDTTGAREDWAAALDLFTAARSRRARQARELLEPVGDDGDSAPS